MHKKLRKALVYVILLVLVLIVAVWFSMDGILRSEIQSRATAALGTKTTLAGVHLSILGGSLTLSGLTVDNLKGYTAPHLLTMQSCGATVNLHSLLTNTVVIKLITIEGLHISVDQSGLSNNLIAEINHLKNQQSASPPPSPPPPPKAQGEKLWPLPKWCCLTLLFALIPPCCRARKVFRLLLPCPGWYSMNRPTPMVDRCGWPV